MRLLLVDSGSIIPASIPEALLKNVDFLPVFEVKIYVHYFQWTFFKDQHKSYYANRMNATDSICIMKIIIKKKK